MFDDSAAKSARRQSNQLYKVEMTADFFVRSAYLGQTKNGIIDCIIHSVNDDFNVLIEQSAAGPGQPRNYYNPVFYRRAATYACIVRRMSQVLFGARKQLSWLSPLLACQNAARILAARGIAGGKNGSRFCSCTPHGRPFGNSAAKSARRQSNQLYKVEMTADFFVWPAYLGQTKNGNDIPLSYIVEMRTSVFL